MFSYGMPGYNKIFANYWLKAFGFYALLEAAIQLIFFYILNNFASPPISNLEFHGLMWFLQCVFIWPIWWVANAAKGKAIFIQIVVNLLFFVVYSYVWFEWVQDIIRFLHFNLQQITRPPGAALPTPVDTADNIHYQLLKHCFRLSWFFLADYFYNYRQEEKQRLQLAVANKELQLKLLKWHLNPDFYFTTIDYLRQLAADRPARCTKPILQLAKVMEYVIYETREKLISVEKEVCFLNNYLQLINQQPVYNEQFLLTTEGNYNYLKIPPLLLTGFIDEFILKNKATEQKTPCAIHLKFSGDELLLKINSQSINSDNFSVASPYDKASITNLYHTPIIHDINYDEKHSLQLHIKLNGEI